MFLVLALFPRESGGRCVDCRSTSELTCPSCKDGESCQYTVPVDDCSECSRAVCAPDEISSPDEGSNDNDDGGDGGGPNVGAIAGGVIGGVVVIAILTYLAWRFLIKPKRSEEAARHSAYTAGATSSDDAEKNGAPGLTRRGSTHTVHSIASTVLTRASNIIQIAYIPGVTNRANPSSSNTLVPPVPPIPMQHSGSNGGSGNEDQHFFVPGDLRDSTYSGLSGYTDRTSYATRASYAPRSSIASTIYGKQAQVMTPASTGLRAKPTMVSVRSAGGSSAENTPPVPSINFEKFGNGRPKSGASTFSVGSTFLNTATQARAQVVKVSSGLKQVEIPAKSDGNSSKSSEVAAVSVAANQEVMSESSPTLVQSPPTLTLNDSPFCDPPETPSTPGLNSVSTPTLGAVMEVDGENDKDDKDKKSKPPTSTERGPSPFGDEHATK